MASPEWKWRRLLIHVPAGVITALAFLLCMLNQALGIGLGFGCLIIFMVYEINEDRHLHDMAFYDILGYAVGFYAVSLVRWLIYIVTGS